MISDDQERRLPNQQQIFSGGGGVRICVEARTPPGDPLDFAAEEVEPLAEAGECGRGIATPRV